MYTSSLILLDIPTGSIPFWLIFLPVMLFLIFSILLFFKIKKSSVTLSQLLSEKDVVVAQQNAAAAAGVSQPPSTPPTPAPASTSRLISLLTGVTAVIISVCLTSCWIYGYVLKPESGGPDFKNITTLLITLGVGVIPYGFNRISSATKNS
jgi:hypothetical protein